MNHICATHFMKTYTKPVVLIGKVVEQKFEKKNIVKYKITDGETDINVVCIIYDFCSELGLTFKETHECINVGDDIEITGHPGLSRNSDPILYGSSIYRQDCDCDCDSDSDPDYEYESDDESDETYSETSSESSKESDSDSEDSVVHEVLVDEIPLTITTDNITYQGQEFKIKELDTTTPMKISIITEFGVFIITEMIPGRFIAVRVPKNSLESQYANGYDILIEEDFENIVKVLYR